LEDEIYTSTPQFRAKSGLVRGCSEIRHKIRLKNEIEPKKDVFGLVLTGSVKRGSTQVMQRDLATTGTTALLEQLSAYVPDDFINELMAPHPGRGRRRHWSPAQLYRLLLLTLLTPAHSFNLMLRLLQEQRSWRKFAHLPNRYRLPAASQLHDFRVAMGVAGMRRVNQFLLEPLLQALASDRKAVGLIDATDLPAATSAYKKR
jgi:hypothetical protein